MYLKRIALKNIGPHANYSVDLEHGLVGVYGPNGSGKSTLFNAAYACLSNNWGRFEGNRQNNITDTADAEAPSSVVVGFEHQGVDYTVSRSLRPSGQSLRIAGDVRTYGKDADINEQLAERVGIDRKLLGDYVFVAQRGMWSVFAQEPAVRAAAFHRLCRTTRAAKLFDLCGDKAKTLHVDTRAVDEADQRRGRIEANLQEFQVVVAKRKECESDLLSEDDVRHGEDILRRADKSDALTPQRDTLRDRIAALTDRHKDLVAQEEDRRNALKSAEETVKSGEGRAALARDFVAAADRYLAWVGRLDRLSSACDDLAAEAERRPSPVAPGVRVENLTAAREYLATLKGRLNLARSVLSAAREGGYAVCPTCHTPIGDPEFLRKYAADADVVPAEVARVESELCAEEDYRQALSVWETWAAGHRERLKAAEATLEAHRADRVEAPEGDEQASRTFLAKQQRLVASVKALADAVHELQRRVAAAEAAKAAALEESARLEVSLLEFAVSPKKREKARTLLAKHHAAAREAAALDARGEFLHRAVDLETRELAKVEAVLDRNARHESAARLLGRLREDVFHFSRLPRVVAAGNLAAMERDINENLDLFGSPFQVEADDSLGFTVFFPGKPPRKLERLSPGQLGVFALAFRAAVATLFGADVGMMVLDEPTDGLDAANLEYMRQALTSLGSRVRGNRQIIVITHAEELLPAFDQVIRLG